MTEETAKLTEEAAKDGWNDYIPGAVPDALMPARYHRNVRAYRAYRRAWCDRAYRTFDG